MCILHSKNLPAFWELIRHLLFCRKVTLYFKTKFHYEQISKGSDEAIKREVFLYRNGNEHKTLRTTQEHLRALVVLCTIKLVRQTAGFSLITNFIPISLTAGSIIKAIFNKETSDGCLTHRHAHLCKTTMPLVRKTPVIVLFASFFFLLNALLSM